jgi:hypothetical protein
MKSPISPYAKLHGVCYLPRMLDKIRLMHSGELHERYHGWYGKGMDERDFHDADEGRSWYVGALE